jgi:hypothetical protein
MPDRIEGTIEVTVNGDPWTQVQNFATVGPSDRVFVATTKDGITSITFGDGAHGVVPPTLSEVATTYRHGSGSTGNVAKQIGVESDARKFWIISRPGVIATGWGDLINLLKRKRRPRRADAE